MDEKKSDGKLFLCKRGEEYWKGGLLIYAESKEEAIEIYKQQKFVYEPPYKVEEIELTKGVIYDDPAR